MNWIMHFGFTGTRSGMTDAQERALASLVCNYTKQTARFHHGGCHGADTESHCIAFPSTHVIVHPGDEDQYRKWKRHSDTCELLPWKPYLQRNRDIVVICDLLIAAPKTLIEERRSGTWTTIRYARKIGTPVIILDP